MEENNPISDPDRGQDKSGDEAASEPEVSLEGLRAELARARTQIQAGEDRLLRTAAELENFRKRAARDLEHARKFGLESFAGELLQVRDSLELGLAAASGTDATLKSLQEGTEMTLRLLCQVMEKFGIVQISPQGEVFDPLFHEAMVMLESDAEPNTVVEVVQNGYQINDRLLRPARVAVAKAAQGKSRGTA